jgi:hypothetical protein
LQLDRLQLAPTSCIYLNWERARVNHVSGEINASAARDGGIFGSDRDFLKTGIFNLDTLSVQANYIEGGVEDQINCNFI